MLPSRSQSFGRIDVFQQRATFASPKGAIGHFISFATLENTLLALLPISRMVPTTITRITASMTAYSAMSCP